MPRLWPRRVSVPPRVSLSARHSLAVLRRLLPFVTRHPWLVAVVVLVSASSVASALLAPIEVGRAIDNCVSASEGLSIDWARLLRHLSRLAAVYAVGFVAAWAQEYSVSALSHKVAGRLRACLMESLLAKDVAYFDTRGRGDILSRFASDVEAVREGLGPALAQMVTTLVSMCAMLLAMWGMSGWLTAAVCLSVPVVIILSRVVSSRSRVLFTRQQEAVGRVGELAEESLGGLRVIRSLGAEGRWREAFSQANAELREAGERSQVNSGMLMPLLRLLDNATYMLVAAVGGVLALRGAVSVGVIQSFLLYARQFLRPVNMMASQFNAVQAAVVGAWRVFSVIDEPSRVERGRKRSDAGGILRGDVEFSHVSFAYSHGAWALRDVSFSVPQGCTVAIVGGTGAGKTTLINLLARFYDVTEGSISIGGVDIRAVGLGALRGSMAIVLQDPALFSGSVAYNISYSDVSRSSLPEVADSARQAKADSFIERLPDAYASDVLAIDGSLSSGQAQLLSIARAMHSRAPMLVLDEATSCVDSRTELMLQCAMANLVKGRTCIVIAHRLCTVRKADLIIVMDHGRLVEMGTHESLMAKNGAYKHLFDSQFMT